jgi:hypothetical protein
LFPFLSSPPTRTHIHPSGLQCPLQQSHWPSYII